MKFEFATASRIIFGAGAVNGIDALAHSFGKRALVVTGNDALRLEPVLDKLSKSGMKVVTFSVSHEPTTNLVTEGVKRARQAGCDLVIGCGGGSVIDASKAIAILLTNGGEPLDYLEVIGQGQWLLKPSAPCIAVPTTAGTGAEVTRNAVLVSEEHHLKVSLRSPYILPRVALIDPLLTRTMPPSVTASTGLDALTQVIEPFVSHLSNPITDGLCREGIFRVRSALHRAFIDGYDDEARENMAFVSLCGGLALANAKLGAVHGFAGVLGGMFKAPHGVICGRLLPFVMKANINALKELDSHHPALLRYVEIARILTGNHNATANDGYIWVQQLVEDLHLPGLRSFGVTPESFDSVVENSMRSSSMKGNPVTLSKMELKSILYQVL